MKEERLNLELRGSISTVTPFANSPQSRQPAKGKKDPQRLPVVSVWRDGELRSDVLFVPASAIRGMLRRAAAVEIAARFADTNEEVKFSEWLLWSIGGVTEGKESDEDKKNKQHPPHPLARHRYIEGNPLVALFGAGKADFGSANIGGMIGSKLHIAHAVLNPKDDGGEVKPLVFESARAHEDRSPRLPEILPPEELESAYDITVTQGERSALQNAINKLRSSKGDKNELAKLEERMADIKEIRQGLAGNAVGRPLSGYEVIPAGTKIPHRMTLANISLAQAGLFFAALRRFGAEPFLGAHRAHNCGRVHCNYRVWKRLENGDPEELGRLAVGEESDTAEEPSRYFVPDGDGMTALMESAKAEWEKVPLDNLRPYRENPAKGEAKS